MAPHRRMRASVNAAERLQPDARVRNVLGGWAPGSETREAVYANHLDAEVAREAGATRQHIRHGRRSAGAPDADLEQPTSIPSALWAALSPAARAERDASASPTSGRDHDVPTLRPPADSRDPSGRGLHATDRLPLSGLSARHACTADRDDGIDVPPLPRGVPPEVAGSSESDAGRDRRALTRYRATTTNAVAPRRSRTRSRWARAANDRAGERPRRAHVLGVLRVKHHAHAAALLSRRLRTPDHLSQCKRMAPLALARDAQSPNALGVPVSCRSRHSPPKVRTESRRCDV